MKAKPPLFQNFLRWVRRHVTELERDRAACAIMYLCGIDKKRAKANVKLIDEKLAKLSPFMSPRQRELARQRSTKKLLRRQKKGEGER
jgi:hypothetical protein